MPLENIIICEFVRPAEDGIRLIIDCNVYRNRLEAKLIEWKMGNESIKEDCSFGRESPVEDDVRSFIMKRLENNVAFPEDWHLDLKLLNKLKNEEDSVTVKLFEFTSQSH